MQLIETKVTAMVVKIPEPINSLVKIAVDSKAKISAIKALRQLSKIYNGEQMSLLMTKDLVEKIASGMHNSVETHEVRGLEFVYVLTTVRLYNDE